MTRPERFIMRRPREPTHGIVIRTRHSLATKEAMVGEAAEDTNMEAEAMEAVEAQDVAEAVVSKAAEEVAAAAAAADTTTKAAAAFNDQGNQGDGYHYHDNGQGYEEQSQGHDEQGYAYQQRAPPQQPRQQAPPNNPAPRGNGGSYYFGPPRGTQAPEAPPSSYAPRRRQW